MSLYEGIKAKYPKLPEKLSAYVQISRPFTVLAPVVMAFFIMAIERLYNGSFVLSSPFFLEVILAGISMGLLQVAGQVSNQICDGVEYDEACGKEYRPLCRGIIDKSDAWTVVFLSTIVSLNLGFYISRLYGVILTILLFFAIFNNLDPIRAKKRYMVNEIWLGLSRGFIPPIAFWIVLGDFGRVPFVLGIIGFLYVFSTNWVKDVTDYEGDKKFNVDTLVVHFDKDINRIVSLMYPFVTLMILSVFILVNVYSPWFAGLMAFPIIALVILMRMDRGDLVEADKMENTVEWVLFYLGLVIGYGLTFLIFRFEFLFSFIT